MLLSIHRVHRAVAFAVVLGCGLVQPALAGGKFMSHFGGGGGGGNNKGRVLSRIAPLKANKPVPFKNGNLGFTGKGMPQAKTVIPFKNGNTGITGIGMPQTFNPTSKLQAAKLKSSTTPKLTANSAILQQATAKAKLTSLGKKPSDASKTSKVSDLKKIGKVDKLGKKKTDKKPGDKKPDGKKPDGKKPTTPPTNGKGDGQGNGQGDGTGPGTGNGDGTGNGQQNRQGLRDGVSSLLQNLLSNLGNGGGGGGGDDGGGGGGGGDDGGSAPVADAGDASAAATQVAEAPAQAEEAAVAETLTASDTDQVVAQATDDASTGSVDLVLEDVKLFEAGTLVAGPAYSVRFRNQGLESCGKFVVAAIASEDGTIAEDSPKVLLDVPPLAAGEMREVVLRMPRGEFSHLIVVVDATGVVGESEKTNNAATIEAELIK